jgi:hypothetical protein
MRRTPAARLPPPLGRLVESVAAAAVILLAVLAAAGASLPDLRQAAVAAPAFVVFAGAAYAFHALTFDAFRLTGRRPRPDPAARLNWPVQH